MKEILNKIVDNRFKQLGFIKIREDEYGASYERYNDKHSYTQCLDLIHKQNKKHLIQSYEKRVNSDGLNNMIGITYEEMCVAVIKMRLLGLHK